MSSPLPDGTPRRVFGAVQLQSKVTAVVGMRRAGKTMFLHQIQRDRIKGGVARERMPYINFEDERLAALRPDTFISMRLQVIDESVRKIQKVDPSYLNRYSNIEWDKLARFRDLVSHHYPHIDHEIVFDICRVHIPNLKDTLQKMRSDLPATDSR